MIKPIVDSWDLEVNRDSYGERLNIRLTEGNITTIVEKLNQVIEALNQILPPEIGEKP